MKNRSWKIENSRIDSELFSGKKIRFSALNQTEKVVCLLIVLTPLWWLWGWSYLLLILTLSVFAYEIKQKKELSLKRPSAIAILTLCFGLYTIITSYFYYEFNDLTYGPRLFLFIIDSWIASAFLLWYIQSKNLQIRFSVVAWAFSIVVIEMLVVLLVSILIYQQKDYAPLRSIFAFITGKSAVFERGLGNRNYLIPYFASDEGFIPGFVRYVFFFEGPEALALVAGFITLIALDIKNNTWSLLLFGSSYFISLLSGTRSVFFALIIILLLRYIVTVTAGKTFGIALILAMMAAVSFSVFSLPLTSNIVFDNVEQASESVYEARADSSEARGKIYAQTWKEIVDAPNTELFWGHIIQGENVTSHPTAKVGSHSFYLSTLLYRSGLIGTILFFVYWASLIWWFFSTRDSRPLCCLMIFVLFSLIFSIMEFEQCVLLIVLICSMVRNDRAEVNSSNQIYSRYQLTKSDRHRNLILARRSTNIK